MMRVTFVAAVTSAAAIAVPTAASAADLTPVGPASLDVHAGPVILPYPAPAVLTGWKVDVGEGGQGGKVRLRVTAGLESRETLVDDPVDLPATPGTYTFPARHVYWNTIGGQLGLEQTTGGHAIVTRKACDPSAGELDPCKLNYLSITAPGLPETRDGGARLALTPLWEHDVDRDLRGDSTEDRTDLQLSMSPARDADGRLRLSVAVHNAGPLPADLPVLTASKLAGGRWSGPCASISTTYMVHEPVCSLGPLAAGETRSVQLLVDAPDALLAGMTVAAEGPDLAGDDNTVAQTIQAPPAFGVSATDKQRLAAGVKAQVRSVRAGRTRVTVAFKLGNGKTVKVGKVVKVTAYGSRSVTVKATGAKLRSLKRAAKRGPLTAEITVRTFSGKTPVTAKTTVVR